MITAIDIAWAAGIYEGEGSCRRAIYMPESKRTGKQNRTDKVAVLQKDPEILYRLQTLFGGNIGLNKKNHLGGACYVWTLSGHRARGFLMTILPLLSQRRLRQVLAMKFLNQKKESPSGLRLSPSKIKITRQV